ncbi:hypothetical protein BSNK01_22550 [Bacillaceae bacterium]
MFCCGGDNHSQGHHGEKSRGHGSGMHGTRKASIRNWMIVMGVIAALLYFSASAWAHSSGEQEETSQQPWRVVVQGEKLEGDVHPTIYDDTLYVPFRFIAVKYGVDVKWEEKKRTVRLTKPGLKTNASLRGENEPNIRIILNAEDVTPKQLKIDQDRVMVPIRYIEDLFNAEIHEARYANSVFVDGNQLEKQAARWSELAYIVNGEGNVVSIVDWQKGKVLDVISAKEIPGAVNSHGIAVSKDGSKVYVASMMNNIVSVYDLQQKKLLASVDIGFKAHHMDSDPVGRYVYVTELKGDKVAVIDTGTNQVIKTLVSGKGAYLPFAVPDGKTLYVTNKMENSLSMIDLQRMEVKDKVKVGDKPSHIAVDSQSGTIYVTNTGDDSISVIASDGSIRREIKVGKEPHGIGVTKEKIFVSNQGSNDLTVIDRDTFKTLFLPIGKKPGHVTVTPDNQTVLVEAEGDKQLIVLDAKTLKIKDKMELLSDGHQIAIPR